MIFSSVRLIGSHREYLSLGTVRGICLSSSMLVSSTCCCVNIPTPATIAAYHNPQPYQEQGSDSARDFPVKATKTSFDTVCAILSFGIESTPLPEPCSRTLYEVWTETCLPASTGVRQTVRQQPCFTIALLEQAMPCRNQNLLYSGTFMRRTIGRTAAPGSIFKLKPKYGNRFADNCKRLILG